MSNRTVLYEEKSELNSILVTKENDTVTLWTYKDFKNNILKKVLPPKKIKQSAINLANPLFPELEYTGKILQILALYPNPNRIMIIGLGGGYLPASLEFLTEKTQITAVEIDPLIFQVAQKFFNFSASQRIQIIIDDAAHYIGIDSIKYDLIILDAYLGDKIPEGLSKNDFLLQAKKKLETNGALIVNLFTGHRTNYENFLKKLDAIFSQIWTFPCTRSGNCIAMAADHALSAIMISNKIKAYKKILNRILKSSNDSADSIFSV